jgi:multiple sugar transport system permease protein
VIRERGAPSAQGLSLKARRPTPNAAAWLFALPHLLLWAVFLVGPVLYGFYISLHRWHVLATAHPLIGFENYRAALPVVISIAVVAVIWRWIYNTDIGLLNLYAKRAVELLRGLGLWHGRWDPIPWLSNPRWVMPSIALMSIWWGAGGNMVLYLAGINNIPDDYFEAATIDGANAWHRFWAITWPLLRPTTLFCLVFSVLGAFQIFGQTYVLYNAGSGPHRAGLTLALYMYQQGFSQYEMSYGAAVAYLLFAILLALTAIQFRLLSGQSEAAERRAQARAAE